MDTKEYAHRVVFMFERRCDDRLGHAALGLCSEAGELASLLRKRLVLGEEIDPLAVLDERGDALYFLTLALDAAVFSLEQRCAATKQRSLGARSSARTRSLSVACSSRSCGRSEGQYEGAPTLSSMIFLSVDTLPAPTLDFALE